MNKLSKTEAKEQIDYFFEDIKNKSPKEIKKIKKLAMSQNIPLKQFRKRFCKKCYTPLKGKVRVRNKIKSIECENCDYVNRWKINP